VVKKILPGVVGTALRRARTSVIVAIICLTIACPLSATRVHADNLVYLKTVNTNVMTMTDHFAIYDPIPNYFSVKFDEHQQMNLFKDTTTNNDYWAYAQDWMGYICYLCLETQDQFNIGTSANVNHYFLNGNSQWQFSRSVYMRWYTGAYCTPNVDTCGEGYNSINDGYHNTYAELEGHIITNAECCTYDWTQWMVAFYSDGSISYN